MTRFLNYINEKALTVDEYMPTVNAAIKHMKTMKIDWDKEEPRAYPFVLKNKLNSVFIKLFSEKMLPILITFEVSDTLSSKTGVIGGALRASGYEDKEKFTVIKKTADIVIQLTRDCDIHFKEEFANFALSLSSTIEHELIHMKQYKNRNLKSSERIINKKLKNSRDASRKGYYSDTDEIMAHGNTIIRDLQSDGYDNEEILDMIRKANTPETQEKYWHTHLGDYLSRFSKDDKVIKRLLKYMYQYIEHEEENSIKGR